MVVDANKLTKLKMAIVARFNEQLKSLQIGHEYKPDETLTGAIDAIEFLESCACEKTYLQLIDYYCLKLKY